jgi:hypothetical protein
MARGKAKAPPAAKKGPPPNACVECGTKAPESGPRPWHWDSHLVDVVVEGTLQTTRVMVHTCSVDCRAKRGFIERRVYTATPK